MGLEFGLPFQGATHWWTRPRGRCPRLLWLSPSGYVTGFGSFHVDLLLRDTRQRRTYPTSLFVQTDLWQKDRACPGGAMIDELYKGCKRLFWE